MYCDSLNGEKLGEGALGVVHKLSSSVKQLGANKLVLEAI